MITVPPMLGQEDFTAGPRTYGVEPRCVQTSGGEYSSSKPPIPLTTVQHGSVFRLPTELIVEILSNFRDPHRNTRRARSHRGSRISVLEHMERLTVIRKLTMTCWHLRNMLFPLLWEYVEGCDVFVPRPVHPNSTSNQMVPLKRGLDDQCSYLAHNPTVGAYVQHVYFRIYPNQTYGV